ncbi:MAG TPA: hypothetical protein VH165_35365 [Kofleriaceae bacterium]|jgi:hypothetical protein|nr:hypothetical protein [Kofleriaceae bacterium]
MGDRTDIDALLISALYGELTPADEARLTAHLESHPADRNALADLTQTRAVVRESRLLAVQFEPPQSVSALLLQEAARRAPRQVRREGEGWFQRFVRSLTAHPAMAAAMTLVLIVGVAGTLYVRHADQFDAAPPVSSEMMRNSPVAATPPGEPTGGAPAGGAPAGASDPTADVASTTPPSNAAPAAAAGSGAYRVDLDDQLQAKAEQQVLEHRLDTAQGIAAHAAAPPPPPAAAPPMAPTTRSTSSTAGAPAIGFAEPPAKRAKKGGSTGEGPEGIEVRGAAEMTPKDFPRDEVARVAKADPDGAAYRADDRAQAIAPGGGGGGGAANVGMAAPKPQAAPVVIAAPEPAALEPSEEAFGKSPAPSTKLKAGAKPAKPAPAMAQRSLSAGAASDDFKADARPEAHAGQDKAVVGWAAKQREQVIAYVRANNCRAAANAATEIYNRAPDYYAANVEVDRTIKPCLAYLNSERERTERVRAAAKRANAADTPAAAAPAAQPAQAPPPPATRK